MEIIGAATLYLGDCLEVLPTVVHVDAVVSDPPYGIAYRHSGKPKKMTFAAKARGNDAIYGDDQPFDPSPWMAFENVLLWGANHFYPRLPQHGRWLAWNKLGDMEPWDTFGDVEFAWHSHDRAAKIFSMKWKGLACDKVGENNGARDHPTQKPIALMAWCIEQCRLKPNSAVCDPYMGSGTTGVAAIQRGHRFVGVEREPKYFDIACRRIEDAQRQQRLIA